MKGILTAMTVGLMAVVSLGACKKDDKLTKVDTYADLTYWIENNEDTLEVTFSRGVYNDVQKGNIDQDTVIKVTGKTSVRATVLKGAKVTLFAMSTDGPDFHLTITDGGKIIAETDTVTHYAANLLHPDQWVSKVTVVP